MNKFEKELKEWGEKNERIALSESIECIKKAHDSSLRAIGLFESADPKMIFESESLKDQIIWRTNLLLKTLQEIKEYEEYQKHIDREADFETQRIIAEIIWHIQDSVKFVSSSLRSLTQKN